jgi:uncharacterized damage-inducible protein DinB
MNYDDIKLLYQYNDWANERILDMAEQVSPEHLSAENDFGWGSLRGALVHLMDAEYHWRVLFESGKHVEDELPENFPDVAAIRVRWVAERQAFWTYFSSLSDDDLLGILTYEAHDGLRQRVLWHCLAHVVNHGTQHRAECAALLTGFGHSPGNLDFTVFLLDKR